MATTGLGVGVIGAGKHGQRYLNHVLRDVSGLRLVAVSRQNAALGREQAQSLGVRFHADWRDLVADPAVAAVVVVVPPTLHPAIVEAVTSARKALLIEKPLAASGAAAIAIRDTIRASGIAALMAHTLRWNSMVRAVREHLPGMGALRALAVNQRFETSSLPWLDDPAISGGGIVNHTGVHSFDLVRHLTGREVTRVFCRTAQADTTATEDNFLALLELEGSNALVSASGSRATAGRSGLIDLAAAEGQLVGDHQLHFAYTTRGLDRRPLPLPEPTMTVRAVLESFVDLLERGTPPPAAIDDGVRAVQIAEACLASARTGQSVAVAPLKP
jgi:predicted dehydrogenase